MTKLETTNFCYIRSFSEASSIIPLCKTHARTHTIIFIPLCKKHARTHTQSISPSIQNSGVLNFLALMFAKCRDHSEKFFQPLNFSRNTDFTGVRFIFLDIFIKWAWMGPYIARPLHKCIPQITRLGKLLIFFTTWL